MSMFDLPMLKPILRGDYERVFFQIRQKDNPEQAQNITGWHLRFGAKEFLEARNLLIVKDSNNPGEFDITDPENGSGFIIINPEDTASMTYELTMICDIQATDLQGRPATTKFKLPVRLDVSQ